MLHITLRGLQGHLVRLLLTAFAVMLGVSFVTDTFVLRDSIDNTLGSLVGQASKGLDVSVRDAGTQNVSPVSSDGSKVGPGVPLAVVTTIASVPALQRGLVSQGLTTLAIPWPLILAMLIASGIVGVLAAGLPAMRAMRLNILQAIFSS